MPQIIVEQKVEHYEKWKEAFDKLVDVRKTCGEKSCTIFRNIENANELTLLFEWDDIRNVLKYAQDPRVKAAMGEAGTLIDPVLYLPEGAL